MTTRVIRQSSFSGGEIGPSIEPRDDSGKRRWGVSQAKNCFISFGGPMDKRPGFQIQGFGPANLDQPRLWTWTGARGEPDFIMHFHHGPDGPGSPDDPEGADTNARLSFLSADGGWVPSGRFTIQSSGDPTIFITNSNNPEVSSTLHIDTTTAFPDRFWFVLDGERELVAELSTNVGNEYVYNLADQITGGNAIGLTTTNGTSIDIIGELILPYAWRDIWHHEDETEDHSNPGLKFVQSGDVMTLTHSSYPVHTLERVEARDSTDENPPITEVEGVYFAWEVKPANFALRQLPPSNIRISDYKTRSRTEGFDGSRAEAVDFAVTAVNDRDGESHPGLAITDTRFFQSENNKAFYMSDRYFLNGTAGRVAISGFDLFDDHPGFHIRVAVGGSASIPTAANQVDIDAFSPGDTVVVTSTRGTAGLEDYVFQVRSIRLEEPGTTDSRAEIYSSVSGIPGTSRSAHGFSGPWIVVEPTPSAEEYENIFSQRTPTDSDASSSDEVAGPETTGLNEGHTDYTPGLPLNLGRDQIDG